MDEIQRSLGRLEAMQTQTLAELAAIKQELHAARDRISSLEKLRAWGAGVVSAGMFLGGALVWAIQAARDWMAAHK